MEKNIFLFLICIHFVGCVNLGSSQQDLNNMEYSDSITCADINGVRLDSSISVISQKGDSLRLVDLPNKEKLLFVRYSSYGCQDCIDYVVDGMNKQVLNSMMCFLIAEVPIRDLHVIQKLAKLHSVYRLDSFSIDFDYGLTPYLFQVNQKGEIFNAYIPRKEDLNGFELYLRNFLERKD